MEDLFKAEDCLCGKCRKQLIELREHYEVLGLRVEALYLYTPFFENLIFQFKDAKDLPLAPLFLSPYQRALRRQFKKKLVVAVPSSPKRTTQRGYVPITAMFEAIGIPVLHPFEKDEIKQSQRSVQTRTRIARHIRLKDSESIRDQSIVLVDDVCTTGHSLKACVELLTPLTKDISCWVVAIHPALIRQKRP